MSNGAVNSVLYTPSIIRKAALSLLSSNEGNGFTNLLVISGAFEVQAIPNTAIVKIRAYRNFINFILLWFDIKTIE
jgi:hypothetical protein